MDTWTFTAGSPWYVVIAAALVAIDMLLLRRLPGATYFWLKLPVTLLHEVAHWTAALLCRGDARITSLVPRRQADGLWQLGSVRYEGVSAAGAWVVNIAPLANWALAALIAFPMRNGDMPFAQGLTLLVLVLVLIEAGIPSWDDIKGGGLLSVLVALPVIIGVVLISGPASLTDAAGTLFGVAG